MKSITKEQKWMQSTHNMQSETEQLQGTDRCIRVRQFSHCPFAFLSDKFNGLPTCHQFLIVTEGKSYP